MANNAFYGYSPNPTKEVDGNRLDKLNPYEFRKGMDYELTNIGCSRLAESSIEDREKATESVLKNLEENGGYYTSLITYETTFRGNDKAPTFKQWLAEQDDVRMQEVDYKFKGDKMEELKETIKSKVRKMILENDGREVNKSKLIQLLRNDIKKAKDKGDDKMYSILKSHLPKLKNSKSDQAAISILKDLDTKLSKAFGEDFEIVNSYLAEGKRFKKMILENDDLIDKDIKLDLDGVPTVDSDENPDLMKNLKQFKTDDSEKVKEAAKDAPDVKGAKGKAKQLKSLEKEEASLGKEKIRCQAAFEKPLAKYKDGKLTSSEYTTQTKEHTDKIKEINSRLKEIEKEKDDINLSEKLGRREVAKSMMEKSTHLEILNIIKEAGVSLNEGSAGIKVHYEIAKTAYQEGFMAGIHKKH
jgi:hypothetical protein